MVVFISRKISLQFSPSALLALTHLQTPARLYSCSRNGKDRKGAFDCHRCSRKRHKNRMDLDLLGEGLKERPARFDATERSCWVGRSYDRMAHQSFSTARKLTSL